MRGNSDFSGIIYNVRGYEKMENLANILTNVELANESEYAESAVNVGGLATWIKFVLTDDKPNVNKQRIPIEEFDNLIKTGHFMPIKMASGKILDGHDDSLPLGVITNLKKVGNVIEGIGALWHAEREDDVNLIKSKIKNGEPPQLSWEIFYTDSKVDPETHVEDIFNTSLRATTVVGLPAYAGRTPILSFASKWSESYLQKLPNEAFLDEDNRKYPYRDIEGNVDISFIRSKLEEMDGDILAKAEKLLEEEDSSVDEIKELQNKVAQLEEQIKEKDEKIASLSPLEEEVKTLREFKASVDAQKERQEKLASIKTKFEEAGLEKGEDYFESKAEILLGMDENALNFMIQELVAFASTSKEEEENKESKSSIPPIQKMKGENYSSPQEIAEALRKAKAKK